jgi:hypothetical protein
VKPRQPHAPRHKRSRQVTLGLVLSVSAQLLACERRRCVDQDDRVVEDDRCVPGYYGGGSYHWYYGGYGYGHGSYVGGGGTTPFAGHESNVSRGGFGAHGFGGEGGE